MLSKGMDEFAAAWRVSAAADAASVPGAPAPAASPGQGPGASPGQGPGASPGRAAGPPSGAEYMWVAATRASLPAMAPGATEEIALQVCPALNSKTLNPSGVEYVWVWRLRASLPAMAPGATEEIALQVRLALTPNPESQRGWAPRIAQCLWQAPGATEETALQVRRAWCTLSASPVRCALLSCSELVSCMLRPIALSLLRCCASLL